MDEEAESDKHRRRTLTKSSSIKRKPLANLTNIIHKPQSKKPATSTASNSSIGSTQNPIYLPITTPPARQVLPEPQRFATDRLVGDENRNSVGQRQITQNTKSTRNSKIKDQLNVNPSWLDKTKNNDKKIIYKRKAIDVPLSAHHTKNASNSVNYRSARNVKSNMVEACGPLKGVIIKERGDMDMGSSHADVAQKYDGKTVFRSNSVINRKDKGKAIAVSDDYPFVKGKMGNVSGSSHADSVHKDDGKAVDTPICYRSCPPHLRATSNRSDVFGAEDMIQLKAQTEPPLNKKKRIYSSEEDYTLPQEYVEQQKAYFKEIDDFELEVEEVSV